MARPLRIEYSGAVYHITSRGNARKKIYSDDEDRKNFFGVLETVVKKYNWLCHAYCLMDNHYHLLVETRDSNLSMGMRQLNGVYTQLYNRRHRRPGHVLQGRYKAILVDKDNYLLELCRYVVLNPVRAGLVKSPKEWKWSSYRETSGYHKGIPCLTTDWVLLHFGNKRKEALILYREFVRAGLQEESPWKEVKGQLFLGGDSFIEKFKEIIGEKKFQKEKPKVKR